MRDVGEKLRLPHTWVGKIETGERRLDVAEFVRLCRALQADPHDGVDVVARVRPDPALETHPMPVLKVADRRQ